MRNRFAGIGHGPRLLPLVIPHSAFRIPHSLKLLRNEQVARYTSFRVGGPAEYLARPANASELRAARAWAGDAGLQARYRHTILRSPDPAERPRGTVVVSAGLRLRRGDRAALLALADEHAQWRKVHQPRKPCAGSIFKNPEGTYAGLLIEEAGLKGYRVGGAQISPQHANFIVNVGGATGADVLALIREAQRVVREARGVALETEVEFIGDWANADCGVRNAE